MADVNLSVEKITSEQKGWWLRIFLPIRIEGIAELYQEDDGKC